MYGLSVYIEPEDILDRLSDEDKARFNQCVFTDVHRDLDGGITIDCIVFDDPDPYVKEKHRQKYFSDGSLTVCDKNVTGRGQRTKCDIIDDYMDDVMKDIVAGKGLKPIYRGGE